MTAPLSHPVIPAARDARQEIAPPTPVNTSTAPVNASAAAPAAPSTPVDVYIDLDFLDRNKIASETPYRLSTQAWR